MESEASTKNRRKRKPFFESSDRNKRKRLNEIKEDTEALNKRFYKRGTVILI
jgi:hypothetical protein